MKKLDNSNFSLLKCIFYMNLIRYCHKTPQENSQNLVLKNDSKQKSNIKYISQEKYNRMDLS